MVSNINGPWNVCHSSNVHMKSYIWYKVDENLSKNVQDTQNHLTINYRSHQTRNIMGLFATKKTSDHMSIDETCQTVFHVLSKITWRRNVGHSARQVLLDHLWCQSGQLFQNDENPSNGVRDIQQNRKTMKLGHNDLQILWKQWSETIIIYRFLHNCIVLEQWQEMIHYFYFNRNFCYFDYIV